MLLILPPGLDPQLPAGVRSVSAADRDAVFRAIRSGDSDVCVSFEEALFLDSGFGPGSTASIADHVNWSGGNPLVGPNDPAVGPRFPDMTTPYDSALRERTASAVAGDLIAAALPPGRAISPAEARMLGILGAQVCCFRIPLEAIVAGHAGRPFLGVVYAAPITDETVLRIVRAVG
jgi:purine nucleoside phosphorylase